MSAPPTRLRFVLAVAIMAAAAMSGCGFVRIDAPQPTIVLPPIVLIQASGGQCPGGMCRTDTAIGRDGVLRIDGVGIVSVVDDVDPSLLAALAAAVDSADYARIMAVPFTGECPTALDGQELTYTFHPAGRAPITIASCEVAIDPANPLFRTIDLILLGSVP